MFSRSLLPVWFGIVIFSGMFLMGQDTWPPPCADNDGDGYGEPASASCTNPQLDCDDGNPDVYPGAPELCDGIDNQCPWDSGYRMVDERCIIPGPLTDTGINQCYDNIQAIECPAPGEPFYGQDAQHVLNPMSFMVSPDGLTVRDHVTGLVWQKEGDGVLRDWYEAGTYCESLDLGGYTDWRLPTDYELQSIAHYGRYDPAINTEVFADTDSSSYWSSSTYYYVSKAWQTDFYYGSVEVAHGGKEYPWYVRCVRSDGEWMQGARFTDNGNGTVSDNATRLMWQQGYFPFGLNWQSALLYCQNLDIGVYTDWRLPDIKELMSIVDRTLVNPALDTLVFDWTPPLMFWSSSTYPDKIDWAWTVQLSDGSTTFGQKWGEIHTRCVR